MTSKVCVTLKEEDLRLLIDLLVDSNPYSVEIFVLSNTLREALENRSDHVEQVSDLQDQIVDLQEAIFHLRGTIRRQGVNSSE